MTKAAVDLAIPEPAIAPDMTVPEQVTKDATLLGGYAYQIIRQQSKQVFKLRSQVLADTDPENLHQMRIGTRRLAAALQLFDDVIEISPAQSAADVSAANLLKSVQKLTKALGKVRDLDVMQAWFGQVLQEKVSKEKVSKEKVSKEKAAKSKAAKNKAAKQKNASTPSLSKKEKKVIQTLLKKLKKQRKKELSKLNSALGSRSYKALAAHFKRWTKQPAFSPAAQQAAVAGAAGKIVVPLTDLLLHPGWQIATRRQAGQLSPIKSISLDRLNQALEESGQRLHDLRKQIKRTRYQTEFFRGLYGITYAAQVREFRTLQKVLGELQDQLVISDFLARELGADWPKKLPTIQSGFQSSRLDLWRAWQPLQGKYLKLRSQLVESTVSGSERESQAA
ncbi:MAG: CHAD domain-containing protein [Cyanobacteria bacterium J06623_5]